jgi:hypothetical protein
MHKVNTSIKKRTYPACKSTNILIRAYQLEKEKYCCKEERLKDAKDVTMEKKLMKYILERGGICSLAYSQMKILLNHSRKAE